jgi:thiol-disulfide isomerase/thioredoxin
MGIKPYWVLVAGFVMLLLFVLVVKSGPTRPTHWLGPGGSHRWVGPGGLHQPLLGPGGTLHPYEAFADYPSPTFKMFKAEWCGHCQKAKPEFEKLKATIGDKVRCVYVDADQDKDEVAKYAVTGFPTFYFENGPKKILYDGPRTQQGFLDFLKQHM